jgi:hypothetical protein
VVPYPVSEHAGRWQGPRLRRVLCPCVLDGLGAAAVVRGTPRADLWCDVPVNNVWTLVAELSFLVDGERQPNKITVPKDKPLYPGYITYVNPPPSTACSFYCLVHMPGCAHG